MLQIFSDAGTIQDVTYAATLIFENWNVQVVFFCKRYDALESCTVGEIMGIEQGMQWVLDNRPDARDIELYVDNLSVAQKLCDYVDNHTVKRGAYHGLWLHIYALCDRFKSISVYHIPSHQQERNPNKVCDTLCSALLRAAKHADGGGVCTQ